MCYEKYLKIEFLQPLAQFRCKSPFYRQMDILATPRDNIPECWKDADEQKSENYSTIILIASTIIITTIYCPKTEYFKKNRSCFGFSYLHFNIMHWLQCGLVFQQKCIINYVSRYIKPNLKVKKNAIFYVLIAILGMNLSTWRKRRFWFSRNF